MAAEGRIPGASHWQETTLQWGMYELACVAGGCTVAVPPGANGVAMLGVDQRTHRA